MRITVKKVEIKRSELQTQSPLAPKNKNIQKYIDFSRLQAEEDLSEILAPYPKSLKMYKAVRANPELRALWDICNYMAFKKLLYSDHGPIHGFTAARNALQILDILKKKKIETDLVVDKRGDWDDVFLVVLTAALFHDVGNGIHRDLHWLTGPLILQKALDEELQKIYPRQEATFFKVYILGIIFSHEYLVDKLTMEASVVGLGDYTDMTKGRSIGILKNGKYNIHTVSAAAIERVVIAPGKKKPVKILVELNNSAGIFHVEEALVKNLLSGKLKNYVEIMAEVIPKNRKREQRIVSKVDALAQNGLEHDFGI